MMHQVVSKRRDLTCLRSIATTAGVSLLTLLCAGRGYRLRPLAPGMPKRSYRRIRVAVSAPTASMRRIARFRAGRGCDHCNIVVDAIQLRFSTKGIGFGRNYSCSRRISPRLPDHEFNRHCLSSIIVGKVKHTASKFLNGLVNIVISDVTQTCRLQQIDRLICCNILREQERHSVGIIRTVQAKALFSKRIAKGHTIIGIPTAIIRGRICFRSNRCELVFSIHGFHGLRGFCRRIAEIIEAYVCLRRHRVHCSGRQLRNYHSPGICIGILIKGDCRSINDASGNTRCRFGAFTRHGRSHILGMSSISRAGEDRRCCVSVCFTASPRPGRRSPVMSQGGNHFLRHQHFVAARAMLALC